MARIVGIHGIAQQVRGPEVLRAAWEPALRDGVALSGAQPLNGADLGIAFYGDLFRARGGKGVDGPQYVATDVQEGFERELLEAWWAATAADGDAVLGPGAATKLRTAKTVQRALNALSQSRFFAGLSERLIIRFIKQLHAYMDDDSIRREVQERVERAVGPDTAVLIGHSWDRLLPTRRPVHIRTGTWFWSLWGLRLASPTLFSTVFDRLRGRAGGSSPPVLRRGRISPTRVMRWR